MAKKFYTQIEMEEDPSQGNHLVTVDYLKLKLSGKIKNPVRVATTTSLNATYDNANQTLTADATGTLSIDAVSVAAGDRVLIKNQTDETQNGIYIVTDTGGASTNYILTRSEDFNGDEDLVHNLMVPVREGSDQSDDRFQLTTDEGSLSLDTTPLPIEKWYTTEGVHKAIGTVTGDDASTTFTVTHNLNSEDVVVELYESDTKDTVYVDVTRVDQNTIQLDFANAPTSTDSFNIIVLG